MVFSSTPSCWPQSATVALSSGRSYSAAQIACRRLSPGCDSFSGKVGSTQISSRIRRITRASRESSANGAVKPTEALISSLSNGEMLIALLCTGNCTAASVRTNTLRIFTSPTQRIACTWPQGIHTPRLGGTVQRSLPDSTIIRPLMA
ncbi:hypothetical protein D3C81_1450560 [compost metagenome]